MKTIIIYASKYGCTRRCAELLKAKLTGDIVIKEVKEVCQADLNTFDQVIIGGSIYVGKIQKQMKDFCVKNLDTLLKKKVGLFISCLNTGEEANKELEFAFPQDLSQKAIVKDYFGGEIVYHKLNFLDRMMTTMVSKAKDSNFPKLDENKNVNTINQDKIEQFCHLMNNQRRG